jgi:IPT/TIG domain-containing protein
VSGFDPTSGPAGLTVAGSGFTGATTVTFDSTAATYTVNGDTQLTATVPDGAGTGPISVTTAAGTGTSSNAFTVTNGGGTGATRYVSGADGNPCSQASPCLTFDRAYRVSSPGDTVLVAAGSYPGQTIGHDGSKSASCDGYTIGGDVTGCVTFQPAAGAQVSFSGGIQVSGDDVRLSGFNVPGVTVGDCKATNATTNVVLQSITGTNLIIGNASYVGDLGGNWGPLHGNQIVYVNDCGYTGTSKPATHVRFDGGLYHDAIQDLDGQHLECLHVEPGDYITIRNSRFVNCAQHDIAIGGGVGTHYLIENNTLAAPCSGQGAPCGGVNPIDASCVGTKSDWTVRFNSLDGAMIVSVKTGCTYGGTNLFYGNVETASWFSQWQCDTFLSYGWQRSYDLGAAVPCGSGSLVGPALVAPGAPAYDFHLLPVTVAIGLVPAGVDRPPPTSPAIRADPGRPTPARISTRARESGRPAPARRLRPTSRARRRARPSWHRRRRPGRS